eukprot:11157571-Lingulodinium_polyedra.AAC.1
MQKAALEAEAETQRTFWPFCWPFYRSPGKTQIRVDRAVLVWTAPPPRRPKVATGRVQRFPPPFRAGLPAPTLRARLAA